MQQNIFSELYPRYKINKPIRLIELFGGIGSQAKALKNIGANFEHYKLVEFDKNAIASYNAIHGTNFVPLDITKINAKDLEIVDTSKYEYILTYSFPCQDLSLAGLGKGMSKGSGTRSGLLWEVERLLEECQELPQVLLMENVPQVHSKDNMEDFINWQQKLESLGYSNYWKDLNAKDYEIPQNRNRTFMISILGDYYYEFPKKKKLKKKLKDLLDEQVEEKFYLTKEKIERIQSWGGYENPFDNIKPDRVCSTLTTHCGKDSNGMQLAETLKTKLCESLIDSGILKENDVINHSYTNGLNGKNPNSRQKLEDYIENTDNTSPCLTTRPDTLGIVVNPLKDKTQYGWHFEQNVYDENGITRAIKAGGGSGNIPKAIIVGNYTPSNHNAASVVDPDGIAPTVMENHGTVTAIVMPEKTKKGYAEAQEGDGVYINRPHQKRGVVQKGMIQTLKTQCNDIAVVVNSDKPKLVGGVGEKKSNGGSQFYQQDRVYDSENVAMCHPANLPNESYNYQIEKNNNLCIRKLTPKEYWRLMSFDDISFEKAKQVNSDAQLYKQAGNSIVVNVLEAIFKQLL